MAVQETCPGCGNDVYVKAAVDEYGETWCHDCVDERSWDADTFEDDRDRIVTVEPSGFDWAHVLYPDEQSPALGSNVAARAEIERARHDAVLAARQEAARLLSWARRHSEDKRSFRSFLEDMVALRDQESVFVVAVEPCVCLDDGASVYRASAQHEWRVSEALRDRVLDEVVCGLTVEGDTVMTYELRLPMVLGDLTDDAVRRHVMSVVPTEEEGGVSNLVRHRYGTCPLCGRSDREPSPEEALDRIAGVLRDRGEWAEVAFVLRQTGRLRDVDLVDFEPVLEGETLIEV